MPDQPGINPSAVPKEPAYWRLMDMDLQVSISLGRAELPLQDVLRLTTGSIIELNRSVGDPVDVVVNERVVARGEVVVVNGNYGVRVQELVGNRSDATGTPAAGKPAGATGRNALE